jgi:endonuclease/exonuclease/phosphatase family metal-dependent hydrolase
VSRVAALGLLGLALAAPSAALDRPVAGHRLELAPDPDLPARPRVRLELRDPDLAPPFPDLPTTGLTLRLHGGAADGQCAFALDLDAEHWERRGGRREGFRHRAASGGSPRALLAPGRFAFLARGEAVPCALEAAQRLPVTVVLEAGGTRWCAAFGGEPAANRPGHFLARDAPAPTQCPSGRVTLADLNILHGLSCPIDTGWCRFEERLDLLGRWIEAAGCPDVVTLQEVSQAQAPTLVARLAGLCGGVYEPLAVLDNFFDNQLHLARHPATRVELTRLYRGFRSVLWTRLDHPLGPLDVFSTHLASSSDGAQRPCGADCPAECIAAGAANVRQCQAVQVAELAAGRPPAPAPALVAGDLNDPPGSFVYRQFAERGFLDVHLAAGRAECDPASGEGCTSGRIDDALDDLESPESREIERIDYVFLVPPPAGSCRVDSDGTGIFADEPNPFEPACGPAPLPICWPSDHEGVELALECP